MVGLVHAVSALESKVDAGGGNYRQRVFAAMPAYPGTITLRDLYAALPNLDRRVIQNAVAALVREGYIVAVSIYPRFAYRVADAGTKAPPDRRGRPPRKT